MKKVCYSLLLVLSILSASVLATGDAKKGQALAQSCLGCHGEFGISPITTNPNLAGQNADYLEYALKAYREGTRRGGMAVIMAPNAKGLSDQDIKDLAAFYSSQPGRSE
jgi:cytochrome c553